MKKLTAILSALMLILAITPAAFATVYSEGYFKYTIADESITITEYFGSEETVTVPAMIAGIPVNAIASGAFSGSGIRELNLPDTITNIESGAIDAGVVINYNSNLPPEGQEQPNPPQPDSPQPNPPQPNLPGIVVNTVPQNDSEDGEAADDITVTDETAPEDVTVTEPVAEDKSQTEQPKQTEAQTTKPAKSDESKSQLSNTNQPEPTENPAVTTTQNAIEEVEAELDILKTEEVTTSAAEESTDSTEETEAAPAAAPKPSEDDLHKPARAVVAAAVAAAVVAVLALVGAIVWKEKR